MLIMSQDRKSLYTLEGLSDVFLSTAYGDIKEGEPVKVLASLPRDVEGIAILGAYKSEGRAMEILEEIANKYGEYLKCDGGYNPFTGSTTSPAAFAIPKVYRMPEE